MRLLFIPFQPDEVMVKGSGNGSISVQELQ